MRGKYLENILTFLYCINYYEINICHSDTCKYAPYKNGVNNISILYTDSHKSFPILWGKCLKRILPNLCSIKYNKIYICHLDIHKNVFHTK